MRASPPLGKYKWNPDEEQFLVENWGTKSVPCIAEHLNRTTNAIIVRAQRLNLGPALNAGDYITLNQLYKAFTGKEHGMYSYQSISWVKNRGLPVHNKRVNQCTFRVVYLDEFWDWAEKNRAFLDFSKMEKYALGREPEWVDEQRKKDYVAFAIQKKTPWTPIEDQRLLRLLKEQKYGYKELSQMLNRSAGAIQRRCLDLHTPYRPVKADVHSNAWNDDNLKTLAEGIRNADSYTLIGNAIGKSEKAVRGKVYDTYLTENADKVRFMLKDGEWGFGAPAPTVKQGVVLSRCRANTKKDLSALAGILKVRMNQLGYDPYWQRFMCMKWDDFDGCSAGCTDCDSCTEFERIRPQYCKRCGATFYERKSNDFCNDCRKARKKRAQKKWSVMKAKGRI